MQVVPVVEEDQEEASTPQKGKGARKEAGTLCKGKSAERRKEAEESRRE